MDAVPCTIACEMGSWENTAVEGLNDTSSVSLRVELYYTANTPTEVTTIISQIGISNSSDRVRPSFVLIYTSQAHSLEALVGLYLRAQPSSSSDLTLPQPVRIGDCQRVFESVQ